MPTWNSPQAFAAAFDRFERDAQDAVLEITEAQAENAIEVATGEARRDLGGDTRFSGWSGPSRDLSYLNVRRLRSRKGHIVYPDKKAAGPWKVAESGRQNMQKLFGPAIVQRDGEMAQLRYKKDGTMRTFRTGKVKRFTGWTAGKGTASRAVKLADRDADRIAAQDLRNFTRKHFD